MNQKILIVDDELLSLKALRNHLMGAGYRVEEADNGRKAYDLLSHQPEAYLAVVLDWMMPEMTGIELVSALQQSAALSHIPVIMLTSVDERNQIIEAIQTGVFDYLIKPVDKGLLLDMLAKALEKNKAVI